MSGRIRIAGDALPGLGVLIELGDFDAGSRKLLPRLRSMPLRWFNTTVLDVSPAHLGLKDQTAMIGQDVQNEVGGIGLRCGIWQSVAMKLRTLLRSCRFEAKGMGVPSTPKARAADYVEYDPYGGVRIDLARWLRSEAGQQQLETLRDLNIKTLRDLSKADETSPAEPK